MFETPLRDLVAKQLSAIEEGLALLSTEKFIPSTIGTRSFIDILAQDKRRRWVLIELKRSDAAAREAIHEIYKYVEAVKDHLGARDDEIRAIVISTEWKELLLPFSRFVHDTAISVSGLKLTLNEANDLITTQAVEPLPLTSGRVLSPWHEVSRYHSKKRLAEGIASYDASCLSKGIRDYVMLEMHAPEGLHQASVIATARAIKNIRENVTELTEEEIAEISSKMPPLDHMIYFVIQIQTSEEYLEVVRSDPDAYEEVVEFIDELKGEELLCTLHEYALDANPRVDRDHLEIGNPAKFRKFLEDEGWIIDAIHRRGAFKRNKILSDEVIISEISGEAGTSGQRLKRSIALSDKAEFIQLLRDVDECLPNNPVWRNSIRNQLEEARKDFPGEHANISVFSPSTGALTLYFFITHDKNILFIPTYSIYIDVNGSFKRGYFGELVPEDDNPKDAETFNDMLSAFYDGDIGNLIMGMAWGGYETRDIDILEHLGLAYSSFRCDADGNDRRFYRVKNDRWRPVSQIMPYQRFNEYVSNNHRLLRIIVQKLFPRIGPGTGMWDASPAERQLESAIDPSSVRKARFYSDPPEACDICTNPLSKDSFMSDGRIRGKTAWANMCADCTLYYGEGIGWGVGQLYQKEVDGRWRLVGGGAPSDDDNDPD